MRFADGWELVEYVWTDELAIAAGEPIELGPQLVAAALYVELSRRRVSLNL